MHEKHRGHEKMHAYMILILLASVVVAQIVLVQWKKRHFKSYQRASMLGMWLIPLGVSVHSHWWRFVFIWSIFTLFTCIVVSWALQKPIAGTTPRWVYKWFYVVHMQRRPAGAAVLGERAAMPARSLNPSGDGLEHPQRRRGEAQTINYGNEKRRPFVNVERRMLNYDNVKQRRVENVEQQNLRFGTVKFNVNNPDDASNRPPLAVIRAI
ncbi:hypothetical protein HPB47_019170 [Ixodes persulcatus]|uniref:Uncharacterized protein n=1 Tax=Ixodes persulcatus TaxID=34615 RepID=A0AC60QIW3_IXOPE|nr:hypothetical protein HPB47_019170 [Ixodes persulcatus]